MIGNIDNLLNLSGDLFQKKEMKPVLQQAVQVAGLLWERGWAERSAGNFSVNVTGFFQEKELDHFASYPFFPLLREFPGLRRAIFLVSGTGTRMRDLAADPARSLCFVYVSDTGSAYHIIGTGPAAENLRPTSELVTHLAVHQALLRKSSSCKAVLHAHVTELIALTHLPAFNTGEKINNLLWRMHPETMLFVPCGTGYLPYTLAGTDRIAHATTEEAENHVAVLWEKHGCLAVGNGLPEAFDILDILAKSARIYFLCRSAGMEPEGLTESQIAEIRGTIDK